MERIRTSISKPKWWLLVFLCIYLLYNLLSFTIGFWEPVVPLSDLPNKIAYIPRWNSVDMAEGKPRSDLIIRKFSGSNVINATANILPGERVGFSGLRWSPDGRHLAFFRTNYDKKVNGNFSTALAIMDENGQDYREFIEWQWGDLDSAPLTYPVWQGNSLIAFYNNRIVNGENKIIPSVVSIMTGEINPLPQGWNPPSNPVTNHLVSPDGWHRLRIFLHLLDASEATGSLDLFGPRMQIGLPYSLLSRTIRIGGFYTVWLPDSRHFVASFSENGREMISVYDIRGNSVTFPGSEFAAQGAYLPKGGNNE